MDRSIQPERRGPFPKEERAECSSIFSNEDNLPRAPQAGNVSRYRVFLSFHRIRHLSIGRHKPDFHAAEFGCVVALRDRLARSFRVAGRRSAEARLEIRGLVGTCIAEENL